MPTITFIACGQAAPYSICPAQEPTLTPWGREQIVSLRKMFYEPPEDIKKRAGWKPERFDLALVEPTAVSRDTAIILLRKQVPEVPMVHLPALCPGDGQTADDFAVLYKQLGNGPLRNWVDVNTGKISSFGAWIHGANEAINGAIAATRSRHTIVIGQAVLLIGIGAYLANDRDSFALLMDSVFDAGEGFRLDSETGAVALIKR